jgi:hypothetical protein
LFLCRRGITAIGLEAGDLEHAISRAGEPFCIHVDAGNRFPALISAGKALENLLIGPLKSDLDNSGLGQPKS